MFSRLPTLLLLAVALFTGFVPLRRCDATDGGGGVVPLGQHGHAHDAADDMSGAARHACAHGSTVARPHAHGHATLHAHADEGCLHDVCGCEHGDRAPATHDRCCVDSPFDAGLASASVAPALPALVPACPWACITAPSAAPARTLVPARADGPPDGLRSVRTTVLLR